LEEKHNPHIQKLIRKNNFILRYGSFLYVHVDLFKIVFCHFFCFFLSLLPFIIQLLYFVSLTFLQSSSFKIMLIFSYILFGIFVGYSDGSAFEDQAKLRLRFRGIFRFRVRFMTRFMLMIFDD
jgi:hypothetical protein